MASSSSKVADAMDIQTAQQSVPNVDDPMLSSIVKLISQDGQTFEVTKKVIRNCATVWGLLEELNSGDQNVVPITSIDGDILSKVLEFAKYHTEVADKRAAYEASKAVNNTPSGTGHDNQNTDIKPVDKAEVDAWNNEFLDRDDQTLFKYTLAANFLNYEDMLQALIDKLADMIKGKTPAEIRTRFNIVNDFTQEEEETVLRENQWIFD